MNAILHKDAYIGRWHTMTLAEQLGNIGSEISRAKTSQNKNESRFQNAIDRALELFDLTLADPRWRGRLKEIGRARELFCDATLGDSEYNTSLQDLDRYFMNFALLQAHNRPRA